MNSKSAPGIINLFLSRHAYSGQAYCGLACLVVFAITPACAGELAFGKAAPPVKAERAKSNACTGLYGEGYHDLAGTGTCVKIGGRVRVDFGATNGSGVLDTSAQPKPSLPDKTSRLGSATQAFAEVDARTPMQGGALRVFARLRAGAGTDWLRHTPAGQ